MDSQDHSEIKPGKSLSKSAINSKASSLNSEVPSHNIKHPTRHEGNLDMTTSSGSSFHMETRGYSELASLLASSPSQTSTIFRRFDKLNMRNLLILENEIANLERTLEDLQSLESKPMDPYVKMKIRSVTQKRDQINGIEKQLKEKVKEYYEGILLTKEMLALSRPNKANLNATRRIVKNRRAGSPLDVIAESMAQHLDPEHEEDLSVLAPQQEEDFLTRFFNGKFASNIDGRSSSKRSQHAVSFTTALFAAIFLIGAIVGLYFVSNTKSRLAMLSTFTLIFAAAIALLTNARRQDVFIATAAYAAVLVVFISGNIAENPIPISCILQAENAGQLNNAALNTAVPQNSVIPTAMATATVIQTVATAQATMTVFSTVVSNPPPTATVIVRKGEMSDLTKTGIGVGASVGLLFCLMIIVCVFLPWLRQKKWAGIWSCGACCDGRRKRDSKKQVKGGRGIWSFTEKEGAKEKMKKTNVSEESRDGQVLWV